MVWRARSAGGDGDVSGDAEMGGIGLIAHTVEFRDGDVIALVGLDSADREVGDGADDHDDGDGNADGAWLLLFCISCSSLRLGIEVRGVKV